MLYGVIQMKLGSDNFQPNMAQTLFSLQKNKEAQASALSTQSNSAQVGLLTNLNYRRQSDVAFDFIWTGNGSYICLKALL